MERFAQDISWVEDKKFGIKLFKSVWKSFREEWKNIETSLKADFKLKSVMSCSLVL